VKVPLHISLYRERNGRGVSEVYAQHSPVFPVFNADTGTVLYSSSTGSYLYISA